MSSHKRNNEEIGYVTDVSPRKVSKRGNPWYEVHMQTSPKDVKRLVGFDMSKQDTLLQFKMDQSPVKLTFSGESMDSITRSTGISTLKDFEIDIPYSKTDIDQFSCQLVKTIEEIRSLSKNVYKIKFEGTVFKGSGDPKLVNGTPVKDDCILQDEEQKTIDFHIWGEFIKELEHGGKYELSNLLVRHNDKYGASVCTERDLILKKVGDGLEHPSEAVKELIHRIREMVVGRIGLVKDFTKFYNCLSCRKKVEIVVGKKIIRCSSCDVAGRAVDFPLCASVQLSVKMDGTQNQIWMTAMKDVIEKVTHNIDIAGASEDDVISAFLELKACRIKYDSNTKIIQNIDLVEDE